MDILLKNATIVTMEDDQKVIENGYVGISDEKICYVSTNEPNATAKRVIDATNKVIMPGLINCHTHIPMSLLRGFADDYNLQDWLFNHVFKAEAKLDEKCIEIGAKLAIYEMLSTGTTSITDMYYFEPKVCEVLLNSGMRGNLCNGSLCFDKPYNKDEDKAYAEFVKMVDKYHNADNGRIKIDVGIHAEYTSNKSLWKFWAETAKEKQLNIHVHISETLKEHEDCKEKYGKTPTQVLSESGVFDVNTTAAHCVFIDDADMDIFVKKGVSISHNPVSNLKLGSGIAPVDKMIKKGINVALGTDSVCSNNTHDLFEEIKLAAILSKGYTKDATSMPAYETLKLATINGAKAQKRDNLGMIKEGFLADIIMIDFDNAHHTPTYDVLSSLVYNTKGSDVRLSIINGKIVYENGKCINLDLDEIKKELNEYVLPRIK